MKREGPSDLPRGLPATLTDQFVSLYVNELTLGYGEEGRRAVEELLRRAQAAGVYQDVRLEFVD